MDDADAEQEARERGAAAEETEEADADPIARDLKALEKELNLS